MWKICVFQNKFFNRNIICNISTHDKASQLMLLFKHDQQFQRTYKKIDKSKRNPEQSVRQPLQIKCVLDLLHTST